MKPPVPLEKEVQAAVVNFYRLVGCQVKSTSQARASKVALGLPDLLVFWPARRTFWFHEVKRANARRPSDEQIAFLGLAFECDVPMVIGGLREAVAHVEAIRRGAA